MKRRNLCAKDTSIWNMKNLSSPTFKTLEYTKQEYDRLFASTNYHLMFATNLKSTLDLFEKSRSALVDETYILERLIYKNWNALRKERYMQNMKKLKSVLKKFSDLSIDKLSETIQKMATSAISRNNKSNVNLVSREVVEFYAIRLYSAYQLSEYVLRLIRNLLEPDFVRQMRNNVFLSNNLLYLSTISRIYCIIRRYHRSIGHLYNCFRENISLFKSSESENWIDKELIDQLPMFLMSTSKNTKLNLSKNLVIEHLKLKSDEEDEEEMDIGIPIQRS